MKKKNQANQATLAYAPYKLYFSYWRWRYASSFKFKNKPIFQFGPTK